MSNEFDEFRKKILLELACTLTYCISIAELQGKNPLQVLEETLYKDALDEVQSTGVPDRG